MTTKITREKAVKMLIEYGLAEEQAEFEYYYEQRTNKEIEEEMNKGSLEKFEIIEDS